MIRRYRPVRRKRARHPVSRDRSGGIDPVGTMTSSTITTNSAITKTPSSTATPITEIVARSAADGFSGSNGNDARVGSEPSTTDKIKLTNSALVIETWMPSTRRLVRATSPVINSIIAKPTIRPPRPWVTASRKLISAHSHRLLEGLGGDRHQFTAVQLASALRLDLTVDLHVTRRDQLCRMCPGLRQAGELQELTKPDHSPDRYDRDLMASDLHMPILTHPPCPPRWATPTQFLSRLGRR